MKQENSQNPELRAFMEAKPNCEKQARAPISIVNDLVVSKSRLGVVYGIGSVAGYLLTLAICAQRSIGLSPLAYETIKLFHGIPDPWCAMICGAIFGIAPFVASMSLLNRFQHRYLLFRMTWVPVLVPLLASLLMTVVGPEHDWEWHGYWIASAIGTPYLLEVFVGSLLRQQTYHSHI